MEIDRALIIILILSLGFVTGFLFKWFLERRAKSDGTIYVISNDDKMVYTLELDDYPETIRFKKRVLFKVDTSGESPVRK